MGRRRFWEGSDLAVDLGSAHTLIHRRGDGIVLDEPSVVALDVARGDLLAAGSAAAQMLGRTPAAMRSVRPLRGGVVIEPDVTEQMLRYLTDQIGMSSIRRPRMVLSVPSEVTGVERRAVEDIALRVGARRVYLLESPVAAAIGAGLPITEDRASLVVDLGAGCSDVALLTLGGVVVSRSIRVGGDALDEAVTRHVTDELALLLGERSAEQVKLSIGSAYPLAVEDSLRVRGRDLRTGLPRTVELGSAQVRRALDGPLREIIGLIREVLDRCPPELAGDVLERGVTLTGGGALLRGLDTRLAHELGVPVAVAEDPRRAAARGLGRCVDDFESLAPVLIDGHRF